MKDDELTYKDWIIRHTTDPWAEHFAYEYVHESYDGAPDAFDSRCGYGHSVKECMEAIDLHEEENPEPPMRESDDLYCERWER